MEYYVAFKIVFLFLLKTQVKSLEFNFTEFNQTNEYNFIRQDSYVVLGALQVTPDVQGALLNNLAGRILYKTPFKLYNKHKKATFNTTFVLRITNKTNPGGEGLAFVLTSETTLPQNSSGLWLGMFNKTTNGTSNSNILGIEFDTRKSFPSDIDGNHVGLNLNSINSIVQESLTSKGIRISSGIDFTAHVLYNGETLSVYVNKNMSFDHQKDLLFSRDLNLSDYLPDTVYIGFTASTGDLTQLNCVRSWRFEGLEIEGEGNMFWLWIVVLVLALGGLFGVVYLKVRSKIDKITNTEIEAELHNFSTNPKKFKLKELQKSTGDFSPSNKLGEGGFGMVFKGYWEGRDVAVKRVSEKSNQGKQEFISEITTIGNLNHRNLVKLLGWCYEQKEFLLVYEYLPNGSLDKYLFLQDKSRTSLKWETRMNIIRGLAQALEYLHNGCDKRILHRDIKASNVMLDSEFNPKLGDFGLARMIQQSEMTHHSTNTIAGTPGYMAPETFLNGRATVETDVYAFGVLILEVVSGKKPVYDVKEIQSSYGNSIVNWLWELHRKGTIMEAADLIMEDLRVEDEEEIKSVLILGLACCHPNPNERPAMKTVLKVLMGESRPPDVPTERPVFVWPAMPPSFSEKEYSLSRGCVNTLTVTEFTGR